MSLDRPLVRSWFRQRGRLVGIVAGVIVALLVAVLLAVTPVWTSSNEVTVSDVSGTGASSALAHLASFTIHAPTQVLIHISEYPVPLAIGFWIIGPGAMSDNHTWLIGAPGGTSYTFWSWGGTYDVGAAPPLFENGAYPGLTMDFWVNVTTGVL
jgi:hypothetical protein